LRTNEYAPENPSSFSPLRLKGPANRHTSRGRRSILGRRRAITEESMRLHLLLTALLALAVKPAAAWACSVGHVPVNEQLRSEQDPWLVWVRRAIATGAVPAAGKG
jgi:hypothetical protein